MVAGDHDGSDFRLSYNFGINYFTRMVVQNGSLGQLT